MSDRLVLAGSPRHRCLNQEIDQEESGFRRVPIVIDSMLRARHNIRIRCGRVSEVYDRIVVLWNHMKSVETAGCSKVAGCRNVVFNWKAPLRGRTRRDHSISENQQRSLRSGSAAMMLLILLIDLFLRCLPKLNLAHHLVLSYLTSGAIA